MEPSAGDPSAQDIVEYDTAGGKRSILVKPFDFMDYPNRTHAISEGAGTSLHVCRLIARYIEEHLPAGGNPKRITSSPASPSQSLF